MRRSTTALAAVLATAALAGPGLANEGNGKENGNGKDRDGGAVCRSFELTGNVTAVAGGEVGVEVKRAAPKRLRGKTVTLRTGSRTWLRGTPVAGALVVAAGTVCQLDDADEPAFYTRYLKVKQRDGGGKDHGDKPALKEFELVGVVTSVSSTVVEVKVVRGSPESLVGQTVKVAVGHETEVKGDVAVGATVLAHGWAKVVDGATTYLAKAVVVKEPAPAPASASS